MYELNLPPAFTITGVDCMTLLYHLSRSTQKIGHMDANHTYEQLIESLAPMVRVKTAILESGLYCCNMMNEDKDFWSPIGEKFDTFCRRVTGGRDFHRIYNWIEEKKL
jgi:hypothetical protein